MKHTTRTPHLLIRLSICLVFILTSLSVALVSKNVAQGQKLYLGIAPKDSSLLYMDYRNNWQNYISVSTDATIHPEVDGIKNLTLSVHNRTDKLLDEVKVKVDYVTEKGKTYKSETVTLNHIAPNSALTVPAPDSDEGICVKMQIESIHATSFHFCYDRSMKTGNSPDPYLCK